MDDDVIIARLREWLDVQSGGEWADPPSAGSVRVLGSPYGCVGGMHQPVPVAPTGGRQPIVPEKGTFVPEKRSVTPEEPARTKTWRDLPPLF